MVVVESFIETMHDVNDVTDQEPNTHTKPRCNDCIRMRISETKQRNRHLCKTTAGTKGNGTNGSRRCTASSSIRHGSCFFSGVACALIVGSVAVAGVCCVVLYFALFDDGN